jgi:hypothetical protein
LFCIKNKRTQDEALIYRRSVLNSKIFKQRLDNLTGIVALLRNDLESEVC